MAGLEFGTIEDLTEATSGILRIEGERVEVLDLATLRDGLIDRLAWTAVFGDDEPRIRARWLIRHVASATGAWSASIHDLYMAAGQDAYSHVTTPAINVRGMAYDLARTVFQAARVTASKQVIFELARSEMGYTQQRPGEYASVVLAAAVKESWQGPVFIQGDHYQASLSAWGKDPAAELEAVRNLTVEAIRAGYGNIDIDASTLVDLSLPTLKEQQRANYVNTADLTQSIRAVQPPGVTISIGGEIGEVGKTNSTIEDLDAFMEGYAEELAHRERESGKPIIGMSKISVQTGTSHGGVVLADGSIEEVSVDFDTLAELSAASKAKYRIGGAVQHGASTLPETAFGKFAAANAIEVHLATAFQSAIYDSPYFPPDLMSRMYAYLDEHHSDERKVGQTDAQFYYNARKRALGPFKRDLWLLPEDVKAGILNELRQRFVLIMNELGVAGRGELVDRYVKRVDFPVYREGDGSNLTNVDLGEEGE
ncbi:MAG: class II fructose-bisphosphate aldolase [Chloroflexia bacterium]|nr:class II fructose-bisphosphate aldolase [Chloroflexia bacterium]